MRLVRGDDGELRWDRILLMLALTIVSGYLASSSQRLGSHPDQLRETRMRLHLAGEKLAGKQAIFWLKIARHQHDLYEIARM